MMQGNTSKSNKNIIHNHISRPSILIKLGGTNKIKKEGRKKKTNKPY